MLTIILLMVALSHAQDWQTVQYVDSLLKLPKTGVLLREDGVVFGTFSLINRGLFASDTFYIIVPDSTLVASRLAHDEAIVKARMSDHMTFDEKFITPTQKLLIEKK